MKKCTFLLTSLALCYSTTNVASDASFSGSTLHIPHANYAGELYDVTMSFQAPNKFTLISATPLATPPADSTVDVSGKLTFNLAEISVGSLLFRADIAPENERNPGLDFIASDIMPSFIKKIFPGQMITGLGVLEDNTFDGFSWKPFLSDDGTILAAYANKDGVSTPVRLNAEKNHLEYLETMMAGEGTWPQAMNNAGAMTGYGQVTPPSDNEQSTERTDIAYYSENGTNIVNIGALDQGQISKAFGLNSHGMAVGWSTINTDDSGHTAFMYNSATGTLSPLTGDIFDGQLSFAFDINDAGQIAGVTTTAEGDSLAFIYQDGETTILGSLENSGFSEARAINDKGWTTGFSDTADGATYAFIHDGTTMTRITGINGDSKGVDINTHGHVVGVYNHAVKGTRHGFIYKDGKATDLYDLLPDADKANWKDFTRIQSISDDGTVSGSGRYYLDKAADKWLWMAFTMKP